jgi:outer membrane murein-binding lipoprotein Lpp
MKRSDLKRIITEEISSRIKMIDEAGDVAATNAKLERIESDLKNVNKLKAMLSKEVFSKYLDKKIIASAIKDLDASVKSLEKAKTDLEKKQDKKNKKAPVSTTE